MAVDRTHNPQRGPAQALVELLAEHPELPRMIWAIRPDDGGLRGDFHRPDARAAAAVWAAALGCELSAPFTFEHDGLLMSFQEAVVAWRDVEVVLGFYSSAVAYPAAEGVAA